MSESKNLIYAGKAKDVYETEKQNEVIVAFRDDITAGDGEKKDNLKGKGHCNSLISSKLFEVLEENSVKTQYIQLIETGSMLSKKLEMIPLEVIARNIATGSLLKRFPFEENQKLDPPIIQMDYKNDEYHDPMLNDEITIALGIATQEELDEIKSITLKINKILSGFLKEKGILLVDFKLEFGKDEDGNIVLGDEISPDTCRYWDIETLETLDKDSFRQGQDNVMDIYDQVCSMIVDEKDIEKWGIQ
ncbi:phosphoribosylaminoimidazolesuccinocarboxamide synthase [Methanobrevibacter arboriphilus]|jgi:phosphoribosylaminoimidazole-succinocarboxamide synthase|uniref:Phosphoribosylaminoimidazolesuccinocarboxamide synthase n=1 Tax=Methanobrevibacter arboriphilus TaxID=39441 RepID=A0ACA8R5J4_METAZ|nr:phosphoribosylaminoimidazolesuccinocarboxamide synthase [Methanobrevibacter arboriphilus]MCC7562826.1 phosphoribosylaminoimidazolesuccinocarboxamide synthase [Methanobrevibacter arboriphilus]BBL62967.1 phosphoribosylaminoimidazolesuccinocarboxamide synthase [Methanobrevibacter arboriphilus]GLI12148.1 phosphoribosylaminoimidazolesuccinocarboxamide synthase [Methanobrevibacter arboriphilus]